MTRRQRYALHDALLQARQRWADEEAAARREKRPPDPWLAPASLEIWCNLYPLDPPWERAVLIGISVVLMGVVAWFCLCWGG